MSKIEWTEATWNPIVGCRRVSPGCDNCYAILEAHRKGTSVPHYSGLTEVSEGRIDWSGKFAVAPDHIFDKPLRTRKPTTYFVNSMSDLFGEGVSDAVIRRVFKVMNDCPQHIFQVATKRPNRAVKLAGSLRFTPNIWMGVSIEQDCFSKRADLLRKIPAAVRFISAEPLLEPLRKLKLTDIDWLIVGGESGRSRQSVRRMMPGWALELRDYAAATNTAFFFKQWGNWDQDGNWCRSKSEAGRLLSGRIYDEFPKRPANTWKSINAFRAHLADEARSEKAPLLHNGKSPRISLREPIMLALRTRGPADAKTLRTRVLKGENLDPTSARLVNYFAWALVDLQAGGQVRAAHVGRRRRTTKIYWPVASAEPA